jgi:hypothetical protein
MLKTCLPVIWHQDVNTEFKPIFDRNLFAEEEPEETARRLQENSVTMGKMQELRTRMEKLSLQKKARL